MNEFVTDREEDKCNVLETNRDPQESIYVIFQWPTDSSSTIN